MTQRDRVSGIEKFWKAGREEFCMTTDPTFLLCPFCGAAAGYRQERGHKFPFRAECSDTSCGVHTYDHYATVDDARRAWNTRVGRRPDDEVVHTPMTRYFCSTCGNMPRPCHHFPPHVHSEYLTRPAP